MTSQDRVGANALQSIDRTEKKTLLARIVIAGVLIVVLIGALALFEQQQKPLPAAPESMKSPGPSPSLPAASSQNQAAAPVAPPSGPAKAEAPVEPERTGAPQVAALVAGEREGGAKPRVEMPAPSAREDTHPRLIVGKGNEQPALVKAPPAAQTSPAKPAPPESPPVARPNGGGFLVQVGVFSNLTNAEELRKKLVDAGIPAQIEARVQVGPFATQAAATAAQNKLKLLGMAPGILLAPRR